MARLARGLRQCGRAWARLEAEKPYLVIGSPPCVEFSALQNLGKGRKSPEQRARRARLLEEARGLLEFACDALDTYFDQ